MSGPSGMPQGPRMRPWIHSAAASAASRPTDWIEWLSRKFPLAFSSSAQARTPSPNVVANRHTASLRVPSAARGLT